MEGMAARIKQFPREISALEAIFSFFEDFFRERGIRRAPLFNAYLIVEELFTNMVRHATDGHDQIAVSLSDEGDELVIRLTDQDVAPWDPSKAPPFDPDEPLETRSTGGMGLYLVRKLAQSITYEYDNGKSITTVRMRLSE
jgi:anti-sigma regulatory factor (Ser/Thr protein kinase)